MTGIWREGEAEGAIAKAKEFVDKVRKICKLEQAKQKTLNKQAGKENM